MPAASPIWCGTILPKRPHHAYYCLLFWETSRYGVCGEKCRDFTKRLCPTGPVSRQLWLIKRILSTTGKGEKSLFSASSPHLSHNFLSCPRGTNVQLPNANSVRSYCCYFPCEKCQMDGDFLLYDFTGVVTIPCQEDTLSQFDKWGVIIKSPLFPKTKTKATRNLDINHSAAPT